MIATKTSRQEEGAQLSRGLADEAPHVARRPASGTMARVVPHEQEQSEPEIPEGPKTEVDLSAFADEEEPTGNMFAEDPTRVSSPLRLLDPTDEEMTREYRDLPTRVMHEDGSPPSSRPSASVRSADNVPTSGVQPVASVVVADESGEREIVLPRVTVRRDPTPNHLEADRALLRALTTPRFTVPAVVAIRPAPPSPRMLAVVAAFTALGMLWVMAVCAMILVLVTH